MGVPNLLGELAEKIRIEMKSLFRIEIKSLFIKLAVLKIRLMWSINMVGVILHRQTNT